jgi:hypothetical protein
MFCELSFTTEGATEKGVQILNITVQYKLKQAHIAF